MTVRTKKLVSEVEVTTTDRHNHTKLTTTQGIPYCLDAGDIKAGTAVTISVCYPSPLPTYNRDISQQWVWEKDATFRPYANQNLCLTNGEYTGQPAVTLEVCQDKVTQHWGYHGGAPGNDPSGDIYYGDATNSLGVIVAN
jgi:hypothetical protein